MSPLLLLDVDGVLNVSVPRPERRRWEWLGWTGGWMIWVSRGTTYRVASLAREFDIVWCTAWNEDAHGLGVNLGWESRVRGFPFPVLDTSTAQEGPLLDASGARTCWKIPAVRAWSDRNAQGRALAWLDDDLAADAVEWADARNASGAPTRLVPCDESRGLGTHQTSDLLSWARSLREAKKAANSPAPSI